MSYLNISSYESIVLVSQTSAIPHLNSELQIQNPSFDISSDESWNSYSESLAVLPLILSCVVVSFVLIILVIISVHPWSRCTKLIATSISKHDSSHHKALDRVPGGISTSNLIRRPWAPSIRSLTVMMAICLVIAMIFNNSVFFANDYLSLGVDNINDNLDPIVSIVDGLDDDGKSLTSDGIILSNLISNSIASCPDASTLIADVTSLNAYVSDYNTYISPLPDLLSDIHSKVNLVVPTDKDIFVWIIYSVFYLVMFSFAVAVARQSKAYLRLTIICNSLVIIVHFITGSLLMAITIGSADFCISPFDNLIKLLPQGNIQDISSYYITCQDTNPIAYPLSSATDTAATLQASIASLLQTSCASNNDLIEAEGAVVIMQASLSAATSNSICPPIQSHIYVILSDGLCDDSFTGLYITWLWLHSTCAMIVFAMIIVTIIHEYYGRSWSVADEDHEHDHDPALFPYDEEHLEFDNAEDEIVLSVLNPGSPTSRRRTMSSDSESAWRKAMATSSVSAVTYNAAEVVQG